MRRGWLTAAMLVCTATAQAEVVRVEVRSRTPFAEGRTFGDVGAYEKITGVVHYALDPKHPANRAVVDLDLAPVNAEGRVECSADFQILAPKDEGRGNGTLFYDVNNRGNKLAIGMFNRSPVADADELAKPELNGFLMRRGYTVVWSGWIGELLPGGERLLLKPPPALTNGQSLRGRVRFEFSVDAKTKSAPISRRDGHGSYPPTLVGEITATLTMRRHEADPRIEIPRDKWRLQRMPIPASSGGVAGSLPQIRCELLEGTFEPGALYEVIYEAEGALVMGTGLTGVRDLIAFLRYELDPTKNPLARKDGLPRYRHALAFGVSQSGRFLRHFLWQGFNEDERGRVVFDGLMPHVAGGGIGFFNHRFAQPTRHNGQHEDHAYPCDVFPFEYGVAKDPYSGATDGLLAKAGARAPKVMHTQSAAEYWHRSGSLVHTDGLGERDAEIPANVRIYAFGGTQHGPAPFPPERGIGVHPANPGDYRPFLRALLDDLHAWVKDGKEPPASVYPRIADRTLIAPAAASRAFPKIPGVTHPEAIQQPPYADYGPEARTRFILSGDPPKVTGAYRVLVPAYDIDGNDLGMLLPVEVAVPLATFTGWNLRRPGIGGDGSLANLLGSYLPFPATEAERAKSGDPRRSLAERYGSHAKYVGAFRDAADRLVERRLLLPEDARRLVDTRDRFRKGFAK